MTAGLQARVSQNTQLLIVISDLIYDMYIATAYKYMNYSLVALIIILHTPFPGVH